MKYSKYLNYLIIMICLFVFAGCGEESPTSDNGTSTSHPTIEPESDSINTDDEVIIINPGTQVTPSLPQHTHYYVYTSNLNGTHTVTCKDEDCDYEIVEDCTFTDKNNCARCDYVHNHSLVASYLKDGVHKYTCTTSWCDYEKEEKCEIDIFGRCKVCSEEHKHTFEIVEHSKGSFYEECSDKTCEVEHFLWQDEPVTFYVDNKLTNMEATDFYLMQPANLLSAPDVASAKLNGKKNKDDLVNITGQVTSYKGKSVLYYKTSDGNYILDDTNEGILRLTKSDEVMVHKAPGSGSGIYWYNKNTFYKAYKSKDEAIKDICGMEYSEILEKGVGRTDSAGNYYYDVADITLLSDKSFLVCESGIYYIK